MQILFISHKYPPTIGGMEKQCYELIKYAEKEHVAHRVVYQADEETKFRFFLKLRRRVKQILQQNPGIEVIHLNDGLMGLFSIWLKGYTAVPVVITFHGLDLVYPNGFYQRQITRRFSQFDAAICVSSATADACRMRQFPTERVWVVPNGVDSQLAEYKADRAETLVYFQEAFGVDLACKKVIVLLGRSVKRKGFSWFLNNVVPSLADDVVVVLIGPLSSEKSMSLLPKAWKEKLELLAGGVKDEAAVSMALRQANIRDKVIQTGKLPFERLLSVLSLANIFAMPNIKMHGDMEGFGLVALEASLRGALVLASAIDGIPDAIQDGKNGYLLPSADASTWISTLKALLSEQATLKQQAAKFTQFTLSNYSWEKMGQGYINVFAEVIAGTKTKA